MILGEEVPTKMITLLFRPTERIILTSEDEETGCKGKSTQHHWRQSCLRDWLVVVGFELVEIVLVVIDVHSRGEEDAD